VEANAPTAFAALNPPSAPLRIQPPEPRRPGSAKRDRLRTVPEQPTGCDPVQSGLANAVPWPFCLFDETRTNVSRISNRTCFSNARFHRCAKPDEHHAAKLSGGNGLYIQRSKCCRGSPLIRCSGHSAGALHTSTYCDSIGLPGERERLPSSSIRLPEIESCRSSRVFLGRVERRSRLNRKSCLILHGDVRLLFGHFDKRHRPAAEVLLIERVGGPCERATPAFSGPLPNWSKWSGISECD
jgi:hypothetical protein